MFLIDGQLDWSLALLFLLACVCHGVILFEIWTNRNNFPQARESIRCGIAAWTRAEHPRVKQRMEELRMVFFCKFACLGRYGALTHLIHATIQCVILHPTYTQEQADYWRHFFFVYLLLYSVCTYASKKPSVRSIYLCGAFLYGLQSFLPLIPYRSSYMLLMNEQRRSAFRITFSLCVMDVRVTALCNFLASAADLRMFDRDSQIFAVVRWLIFSVVCAFTECWIKEFIVSEFAAKDARRNMQRLLGGLCDSVIELLPDLRIAQAPPQLLHLLCPNAPLRAQDIQGVLFSELLATEMDKESFERLVSQTSKLPETISDAADGAAPAFRVSLRYGFESEVSVELFHVKSEDCPAHLIGLREVRPDGAAPDETAFKASNSISELGFGEVHMAPGSICAKARKNSKLSRSGQSSRSLHTSGSSNAKRDLIGLDRVELALDIDLQILEYNLHFSDARLDASEGAPKRGQKFRNCVVREHARPFANWLADGVNKLLNEDIPQLEYPHEVRFRPPTVACASSKVILSADSATLSYREFEEDAIEAFPTLILQFYQVKHVIASSEGNAQAVEASSIFGLR